MPRKLITLEGDALEWFLTNAPDSYRKPIIDGLAQFGVKVGVATVSRLARDLGVKLKDARTSGDAGRSTRKVLPEAAIQRAVDLIKTQTLRQTTKQVCAEFGLSVSETTLKRRIVQAGGEIGNFWLKPGFELHWAVPIGTEYKTKAGHTMVKVCEDPDPNKSWRNKHVYEWEKLNGPVPEGYMVRMVDPDRQDYSPENLVLVSLAQNIVLNKHFKRHQLNAGNIQSALVIADITLASAQRAREVA